MGEGDGSMTATLVSTRVKSEQSVADKVKGFRKAQHILDYLGARVAVDTLEDGEAYVEGLGGGFEIVGDEDFFDIPVFGYRARHVFTRQDAGLISEVQIVPSELAQVQEAAHGIGGSPRRPS